MVRNQVPGRGQDAARRRSHRGPDQGGERSGSLPCPGPEAADPAGSRHGRDGGLVRPRRSCDRGGGTDQEGRPDRDDHPRPPSERRAVQPDLGDARKSVPTHPARNRLLQRVAPGARPGIALARQNRAPLSIVHALPPPVMIVGDGFVTAGTYEMIDRSARQHARKQLTALVGRAKKAGVRATGLLLDGAPHEQIPPCRPARARGPDRDRDPTAGAASPRFCSGASPSVSSVSPPVRSSPSGVAERATRCSAKDPIRPSRSKKGGQPPQPVAVAPRVRRRPKTGQAAVRKDTSLLQPPADRARGPASKPKFPKR